MNTTQKHFKNMLKSYRLEEDETKRKFIDADIWKTYGVTKAVMITDMSGFSYTTEHYGSVHFLSMIQRMQNISKKVVSQFNGTIVKFEADNCFIVFDTALDAIESAIELNKAFKEENATKHNAFDINISCGIAYGEILLLDNEDMYGKSVILASKLGEDMSSAGEIFTTQEVMNNLPLSIDLKTTTLKKKISKIDINYYSIHY